VHCLKNEYSSSVAAIGITESEEEMKVSVITICLNCREYIDQALASVCKQNYPDLELIIVDGGSSDGTLDIVKAFAAGTSRIRWISEPDRGIGNALNKGVELASGDVIGCLNADDYYTDETVISQVAGAFMNPDVLWVTGGIREVDNRGNYLRTLAVRRFSRRRLLRNNIIFHPATFVRRTAICDMGGFDESLKYAMDYDLWLRLSTLSVPVPINKELACFRVHSGSISSANRIEALHEEYLVRNRHLSGPVESLFHALYQKYRVFVEK
jgi:glycosyltransferase involved in cell wall biosynthesis